MAPSPDHEVQNPLNSFVTVVPNIGMRHGNNALGPGYKRKQHSIPASNQATLDPLPDHNRYSSAHNYIVASSNPGTEPADAMGHQRKISYSPNKQNFVNKNAQALQAQHSRQMSQNIRKNNNGSKTESHTIQHNFATASVPSGSLVSSMLKRSPEPGVTGAGYGPQNVSIQLLNQNLEVSGPNSKSAVLTKTGHNTSNLANRRFKTQRHNGPANNVIYQHSQYNQLPSTSNQGKRMESPELMLVQKMKQNRFGNSNQGQTNDSPETVPRPSSAANVYRKHTPQISMLNQGLQGGQKMHNVTDHNNSRSTVPTLQDQKTTIGKMINSQTERSSGTKRGNFIVVEKNPLNSTPDATLKTVSGHHSAMTSNMPLAAINDPSDNRSPIPSGVKTQPQSYNSGAPSPGPQKINNVVTKFSFATKTGMAPHNPYKVNQDAYITCPHFLGLRFCHFFSVCDGHGQYGREVSGLMKHRLPFVTENNLKAALQGIPTNVQPELSLIEKTLKTSFAETNQEVYSILSDVRFSGSTCVTVITYGRRVFCANVGDSRAILLKVKNDILQVEPLSRDHKPDDQSEAQRIYANNGRIDSFRDPHGNPLGPLRVWLKNEDIPGLAMTRSFGDGTAAKVGVNADPEIFEFQLTPDDKVIVLASDGVWEFLENLDVAKLIYPFYQKKNAEGAAECLVRESFKQWRKEEDVIDDITCIVIFLDVR